MDGPGNALALKDEDHAEVGDFLLALANMLLNDRGASDSWRLQYLSDLKVLPDYEDGWMYYHQTAGAPVDADGNPVFHRLPKSFAPPKPTASAGGGASRKRRNSTPRNVDDVRMQFAGFLLSQFGVQTMAESGWRFGRAETDDTLEEQTGIFALATLGENETIARLATGVKRFKLPDEFNYIKIYQAVASNPKADWSDEALEQLGQIFENRRQYSQAAGYWRTLVKGYPRESAERRHALAAAARPDHRQLGPLRADPNPARRPRRQRRLSLPQRPESRVRGLRNQGRKAAGRR